MSIKVPLLDLKRQYAQISEEVGAAFGEVLESQVFIGGPRLEELEEKVAAYCGAGHAVGMSSGTDAITAALMSLGVCRSPLDEGPADEVIVPAYTFFATAGAVWRNGARPVFADIDPVTFNMDASAFEGKITPRTKAVIPVHLYGQCADMEEICAVAKKHGLKVVEDCAQSIGATRNGRQSGSFGDCGCLSFFPTKNLGGFGDGGMVVTNDSHLASELRRNRNHGMDPKYYHRSVGGNFRLDALQAAGLAVKLKYLDSWAARRAENAAFYDAAFADCPEIVTPKILPENKSVYNQYIVRVPNRDAVIKRLHCAEIGCEIYYPLPLHLQECFASLGHKVGDFPHSERAAAETIALPIFPELSLEELECVAKTLKESVRQ